MAVVEAPKHRLDLGVSSVVDLTAANLERLDSLRYQAHKLQATPLRFVHVDHYPLDHRRAWPVVCPSALLQPSANLPQALAHSSLESLARRRAHTSLDKTVYCQRPRKSGLMRDYR